MKISRTLVLLAVMGSLSLTMYSCKTKKAVAKPAPAPVAQTPPPEEKKPEPPAQEPEKPAEVEKPNYNFSNIQFEFNSDVLKTESIQALDHAVAEMRKDSSVKFILNGNSSAEGTPEHNMSLSVDRANAVKSYLVNAGISASNFTVKGYGATKPIASNSTDEGKAQNRRVEIKVVQ
jgi:outer membrane protein OmpA-like peptidoglycan-associated protein